MLDHVSLPVSKLEESKRFYEEALSQLRYELIMEHHISGSGKVHLALPSTLRSSAKTVLPWTPSTRQLSRPAGAITGNLGFDLSTTQPTTARMSSIPTATTSKQSAIGQTRKPKASTLIL